MNRQDFLTAVRKDGSAFRADNIVVTTDAGQLQGKGMIKVEDGRFRIRLTLSDSSPPAQPPNGIRMHSEFWLLEGTIEDDIGFRVRGLPSNSSLNYTFGRPQTSSLEFSANRMELAPIGFDALTRQEIQQLQQKVGGAAAPPNAVTSDPPLPHNVRVSFDAVLLGYKLIEHNGGTETKTKNDFLGDSSSSSRDTFYGIMPDWEYGLVERGGDLHLHLISRPEYRSTGEDHDWRVFHAFLNALAFTHAQHAWPFSVQYRREGKLTTDRIQLNKDVADSPHAPFSEALAFNNLTKALTWNFGDALEKAHNFFSLDSKVAREVENLLFIFREATTSGIPKRIALLSLCSLIESLVRVVYDEEIAPQRSVEEVEFQTAKTEVCGELSKGASAYQRLATILTGAEPVNARMRFNAAVEHLGLKPQGSWQALFDLWRSSRNPISHRMSKGDQSEDSVKEELIAESRIAGAINCMILRLMGYSGYVRQSVYEDKYTQI